MINQFSFESNMENIKKQALENAKRINRLDRGGKAKTPEERSNCFLELEDQMSKINDNAFFLKIKKLVPDFQGNENIENSDEDKDNHSDQEDIKTDSEERAEAEILSSLQIDMADLGINEEKLKEDSYSRFNELGSAAKMIVLKNLKAIVLSDVSRYALDKAKEETPELKGLFSKFRKGLKVKSKSSDLKEEIFKIISKDGLNDKHLEKLNELSGLLSSFEIDVWENNNKIEASFIKENEGMSPEEKLLIANFNRSANDFLNIPKEHFYNSAKKQDKKRYQESHNKYEKAREDLFGSAKNNYEKRDISEKIAKANFQLLMLRDFQNDSVLKSEWDGAVKNRGLFKKILSNMTTKEGAAYLGSGFISRSVGGAIFGAVAAIPAMMTIGAIRGWRKGKDILRSKDAKDVYGFKKESSLLQERGKIKKDIEYANSDDFYHDNIEYWTKKGIKKEDIGTLWDNYKKGLVEKLNKIDENLKKEKSKELSILKAKDLSKKISRLIGACYMENDYQKRQEILRALRSRVDFTEDKLRDELVSYDNKSKAFEIIELNKSLADANMVLNYDFNANEDLNSFDFNVKKRLNYIFDKKNIKLEKERKKYVISKAVKGALFAGALTSVSYLKDIFSSVLSSGEDNLENIVENIKDQYPDVEIAEELDKAIDYMDESLVQNDLLNTNDVEKIVEGVKSFDGAAPLSEDVVISPTEILNEGDPIDVNDVIKNEVFDNLEDAGSGDAESIINVEDLDAGGVKEGASDYLDPNSILEGDPIDVNEVLDNLKDAGSGDAESIINAEDLDAGGLEEAASDYLNPNSILEGDSDLVSKSMENLDVKEGLPDINGGEIGEKVIDTFNQVKALDILSENSSSPEVFKELVGSEFLESNDFLVERVVTPFESFLKLTSLEGGEINIEFSSLNNGELIAEISNPGDVFSDNIIELKDLSSIDDLKESIQSSMSFSEFTSNQPFRN